MNFVGDEVISVTAGDTKTLSRSLIDQVGSTRATRARIFNHDIGLSTEVGLRFRDEPDVNAYSYEPLAEGERLEVNGYDNLRDLQIVLIGSNTAKLFVQYFA